MKNKQGGYINMETVAILLLLGVTALGIIVPIIGIITGFGFPDNGEHIGYVTAVEQGGYSNDYTAYVKTELESSQEDSYCVQDVSVVEDLKEKARTKENVVISYSRGWFEPITVCNGEATVIVGVESK